MKPIRVAVNGALGRMGLEVMKAVCREPDMELVGAVDLRIKEDKLARPDGSGDVPAAASLDSILTSCQPDVLVDFTIAQATIPSVRAAARRKVNLVIGTTGLAAAEIDEIKQLVQAGEVGAVVAPNFALGAVLMMHLAALSAKYLDYAEIIELHHNLKVDAPSGTALSTARKMAEARGRPFEVPSPENVSGSRGEQVAGVTIHSVRLPGLLAHQEVILGGLGQTLSIRHDTISRECFMPGVIMAIKKVIGHKGLIYGLDVLLGLRENT